MNLLKTCLQTHNNSLTTTTTSCLLRSLSGHLVPTFQKIRPPPPVILSSRHVSSSQVKVPRLPVELPQKIVQVGPYRINTVKAGHGPNLIFLLPGGVGTMDLHLLPQIVGFDPTKFTVYSWDQPGFGRSKPPEREFGVDSIFEDPKILVAVLKELGIVKCSIGGWSMGGLTAMLVAINNPEIVERLVVWSAFTKVTKKIAEAGEWFKNTKNWGSKLGGDLVTQATLDYHGEEFFKKNWDILLSSYIKVYTHHGGEMCAERLYKIQCPTLILHASGDTLFTVEEALSIHKGIKDARFVLMKGKHDFHLRKPQEFNRIVQNFLLDPITPSTE